MSNPTIISSSPLSLIALLPGSLPPLPGAVTATPGHDSIAAGSPKAQASPLGTHSHRPPVADIDWQARRLSLGPGLGTGMGMSRWREPKANTQMDTNSSPGTADGTPESPSGHSFPVDNRPSSSNLSMTDLHSHGRSAQAQMYSRPRGSVAMPSGMGFTAAGQSVRSRPGAEGDQLVNALRQSGFEVAVIGQSSLLPSLLTAGSTATPVRQVILVPLGDTPPVLSLSLLAAKGTTPSAVCFQQDLLDRARRAEDEWLETALGNVKHIIELRQSGVPADDTDSSSVPLVVGYVNGNLSPSSISSLVEAGVCGVLHAPYDASVDTRLLQLVGAGKGGETPATTTASLSSDPLSTSGLSSLGDTTKVVLTPTALAKGAEHLSEDMLAMSLQSKRGKPGLSLSLVTQNDDGAARGKAGSGADFVLDYSHLAVLANQSSQDARRRSVDTGGLALAFDRAAKRMSPTDDGRHSPSSMIKRGTADINVIAGDIEQGLTDGNNPQFAEVLSEMYQQTMATIDTQMSEYDSIAEPIAKEDRIRLVECLSTWDFHPHHLSQLDLLRCACLIFESILHTDGLAQLGIEMDRIKRFMVALRAIYHAPNPYHNYVHAIDVLQATYSFLMAIGVAPPFQFILDLVPGESVWVRPSDAIRPCLGEGTRHARNLLRPQDVFGALIAAIGHDVGHPGLSNAFMKNAKVPLSVVYDDKSVLENMHCMLVVHILRKHGFGFLLGPCPPDQREQHPARAQIDYRGFRRVLYSAILATDMSLHFAWIQRLKEFSEAMQGEDMAVTRADVVEEDRVMICQALLKCADISNPARPIGVSEHWSTVLLEEWWKQASLEEELSLPVSVAIGVDARGQAKGQIGFIDLFTRPLFTTTANAFPEMQPFADSCMHTRSIWQDRFDLLDKDAEANEERSALLAAKIPAPLPSAEDPRYDTLFPLILPSSLTVHGTEDGNDPSKPETPVTARSWTTNGSSQPQSPATQAVRIVYRDEVHDRPMIARQVLALRGNDPSGNNRRMSSPDALLVHHRS